MAATELPFLPPKLLARIFSWTRLADLWRLRCVCRAWSRLEFSYEPRRGAPLEHRPCRRGADCPVCATLLRAERARRAARIIESDDALAYASWTAPYHAPAQLAEILKLHRWAPRDLHVAANVFYYACFEGDLEKVSYFYTALGYTRETRFATAMCCDALEGVSAEDEAHKDVLANDFAFRVLRKLALSGASQVAAWLISAFDGLAAVQQRMIRELSSADSVAEARALADGFALSRAHLLRATEPHSAPPLLGYVERGRLGLALWFVRRFELTPREVGATFVAQLAARAQKRDASFHCWCFAARWFRQQGCLA